MHRIDTASEMSICLWSHAFFVVVELLVVLRLAGVQRRQSSRRGF